MRSISFCLASVIGLLACVGDPPATNTAPDPSGIDAADASGVDGADASASPDAVSPDAGSDTSVPVEAGPDAAGISPQTINGLTLWCVGDKDVTAGSDGRVTKRKDQSTKANDATSTTAAPLLVPNSVNGKSAITFDVVQNGRCVMTFTPLAFGLGDFAILLVARTNKADDTSSYILNEALPGLSIRLAYPQKNMTVEYNNSPVLSTTDVATNDNQWHIFAVKRSGNTLDIRIDGEGAATKNDPSVGASIPTPSAAYLGANLANARMEGSLAELIVVQGSMTPDTLAGVEAYLKYRISSIATPSDRGPRRTAASERLEAMEPRQLRGVLLGEYEPVRRARLGLRWITSVAADLFEIVRYCQITIGMLRVFDG